MTKTFMSHLTLCVSDFEVSKAFYVGVFDFEASYTRAATDDFAPLLGLTTLDLELVVLRLGDHRIELVHHRSPAANELVAQPMSTVGVSHLAFNVDDVDRVAALVEKFGGAIDQSSRIDVVVNGESRVYVIGYDPDGIRIELIMGQALG